MRRYLRIIGKVLYKSTPEQIIFFVTSKCNLDCKMCFYKKSINRKKNELTLDEIRQISSWMPAFHWLQISGGEPYMREDLDKICSIFVKNNAVRIFNIPTNGYFGDRVLEITKRILISNPQAFFNIGISILGLKETHDKITGTSGSFEKAVSCYRTLEQLKEAHSNFGLHFTINQNIYNERSLKKLFDFLMQEYNPEHIALNLARGENLRHKFSGASVQLYWENWSYLLSLILKRKNYFFKLPLKSLLYAIHMLQKEITYESVSCNKFVIPCYAARISAVIDEVGSLYSCEMRKKPLGNFRDSRYDFKSIWGGREARLERREIKKNHCFCSHECFITSNIVFNPWVYPRLFRKLASYIIKKIGKIRK